MLSSLIHQCTRDCYNMLTMPECSPPLRRRFFQWSFRDIWDLKPQKFMAKPALPTHSACVIRRLSLCSPQCGRKCRPRPSHPQALPILCWNSVSAWSISQKRTAHGKPNSSLPVKIGSVKLSNKTSIYEPRTGPAEALVQMMSLA